jgi:hypothetical protein
MLPRVGAITANLRELVIMPGGRLRSMLGSGRIEAENSTSTRLSTARCSEFTALPVGG